MIMRNNRIYIAGKVTGDSRYQEKFASMEQRLTKLNPKFEVVNPAKKIPAEAPWLLAMFCCIRMLRHCDWVVMLRDWNDSRGARWEHNVARRKGKIILYENPKGELC